MADVRPETTADSDSIDEVLESAFRGIEEVEIVHKLRDSEAWLSPLALVATIDRRVVGYCVTSRGFVSGKPVLALGPLGVEPPSQGSGVGVALMWATINIALEMGESLIALLGDPGYYKRFRFVPGASAGVSSPVEVWGDHFQVLRLSPNHPVGTFVYPNAFGIDDHSQ